MDVNLRLILILIGCLIVFVILLDGLRRRRKKRKKVQQHTSVDKNIEPKIDAVTLDTLQIDEDNSNAKMHVAETATLTESVVAHRDIELDPPQTAQPGSSNIIILYVMAQEGKIFSGPVLLQALISLGLRFGKMSLFHRYETMSGHGAIQFSVASAVNPGVFDLNDTSSFAVPGISLFMTLDKVKMPLQTYQLMLDTAKRLNERLEGCLYDEQHQILIAETISHHQAVIKRFIGQPVRDNTLVT